MWNFATILEVIKFMCDLGTTLEVIKFFGRPAIKYLDYHRNFNKYVEDFKRVQADLLDREAAIRQKLEEELLFQKKPKQEVQSWLKEAKEKISHAEGVEDKVSKVKYLSRSCLGKLVDETTQAIKETYDKGDFSGSLVVNNPSTNVKLLTEELVGTAKVEEIYEYLMGDEVRKIGVWGMGGIGKTTIMTHVYNKLEDSNFGKLIWATVTQNFDIQCLQKKIASELKGYFSDDEEPRIRAAKLSEMLKRQRRYVLILDDVWNEFSLNDVGIPEPTAENGSKLVFTTRSQKVVRSMGCKEVQVACLSEDQAWKLFLSKVGRDTLPNYHEIESTMKLLVEECAGLPLAIVIIAGTLKRVSDPLLWENALNSLRGQTRRIKDVEDKVFGCLMYSYQNLEPIEQNCFLRCALYLEDFEFGEIGIIEHWIEEGLIDEMKTRKDMRNDGHVVLKKLEENCLLERVHKGYGFKMHDTVRDMALHTMERSNRLLVKVDMQLTELPNEQQWTEELEKVCLMRNFITKIPSNILPLKCQRLTTLLLSHNRLEEIGESFFGYMPNLKILDLSGNSSIVSLPDSLSNLEKLTALLLSCCRQLKNLPSLSKLKALKKLTLDDAGINKIPQGLEMLVNLRCLILTNTRNLKEIPNGVLSKLCRLQILGIHPAPISVEDIRELNKLEVFNGLFSNVREWNMFASQSEKLDEYVIWVRQVWHYSMQGNKTVVLRDIDTNSGDGIILPRDIQGLNVQWCKGMRSLNDISGLKDATYLKYCAIMFVDEMESIFSSKCRQLETLESLRLWDLNNLKAIVGESSVGGFSSLKKIVLCRCVQIKKVLSAKWDLRNLEEINVEKCEKMEEIIESEEEGMGTNTINYTFPNLRNIEMKHLPDLKRICSENGVLVCDFVQSVTIQNCPKLKRIPLHLPLLYHDEGNPSPSPPCLKEIRVYPEAWWESVEWDHPNAKNVLQRFLHITPPERLFNLQGWTR